MHMDDAGLTDVKAAAFTRNGGVTRSATESKFGGYSAYFDGVDDEVTNTAEMLEIQDPDQSVQFFCWPDTQVDTDPCVLKFRELKIEYKPTGFPYGFVLNVDGTRTQLGVHPEGAWYYIWFTIESDTSLTMYIDDQFIANFTTSAYGDAGYFFTGSAGSANYFAGYVDDLLITNAVRTDYSVPTAAFLEQLPDPEGEAEGSVSFTGECEGIVAPIGGALGSLGLSAEVEGEVSLAGLVSGRLRFTGFGEGTLGRFGVGLGTLRFSGNCVGGIGRFGTGSGSIRFGGSVTGWLGVAGAASGSLQFEGAAAGTTPEHPVGEVLGALRFAGNARGSGGVVSTRCH